MQDSEIRELIKSTLNSNPKLNFYEILDRLRNELDLERLGVAKTQKHRTTQRRKLYFRPRIISKFIHEYLEKENPVRILDPYANYGELLFPFTSTGEEIYGVDPNPEHATLANYLLGPNFNWKAEDPLEEVRETEKSFDAIVSCPPFGKERRVYKIKNKKEDEKYELRDSYSNVLITESIKKLEEEGVGLFVVPESFVHKSRSNSVFNTLDDFGFHIHAAITIPSGTFAYTSIATLLLIIKKEKVDKIFVGKLTKDTKARKALLENLQSGKEGEEPELGAFISKDEFRTVDKLITEREIESKDRRRGLKPFPLSEITKRVGRAGPDSSFEDVPNAIYLSGVASGNPAAETFEEYEGPEGEAIQLVLDEEKVSPDFVASFLNTKLGNQILKRYSSGAAIPRISVRDIKEDIVLFLPELDSQKEFMRVKRKIEDLENQIGRLTHNLWKNPYDYHETENNLEELNLSDEELFKRKIEQLPFPLGSILWAYQASNDPREKVEHLHNFFEATSEFIATILLSAFESDKEFTKKAEGGGILNNFTLSRATFGTWVTLGQNLAKETRRILSEKSKDFVSELFGGADDKFISLITDKELFRILDKTKKYRNNWKGHDGFPSDDEIENRNLRLQEPLQKVINFLSTMFRDSFIIDPKESKFRDNIYHYTVSKLEGYSTPFKKVKIKTLVVLEDQKYYLYHDDKLEPLKLLPLFRVMESPKGQKNTCYFYNKLEGEEIRLVSYQYDTPSEQKVRDRDILSVINSFQLEDFYKSRSPN